MRNIRGIEQITPLRLGFIGYNSKRTLFGMIKFAENNRECVKIFKAHQSYIRLKDGTEIIGLYEHSNNIKGQKIDQLILFDDDRWAIKSDRYNFIQQIIERCMSCYSCVPEELQIIEYED